jgi:molybdopterin molybdotransferase
VTGGDGGEGGDRHAAWLFGLPGNPVAVMVTFYQFVRDALYLLMGADPLPVACRCCRRMQVA